MARHLAWLLVVSLGSAAAPSAEAFCEQQRGGNERKASSETAKPPRSDGPRKWWLDRDDRKALGITDQQSHELNQIWESLAPKQRELFHELRQLEESLSTTIKDGLAKPFKEGTADVAVVAQQAERAEFLRAKANKNRIVMLYKMNLLLSPE
jgi:hypothetical protein